ncbi:MAG: hypothetical protein CSA07_05520 [Bacteroidia bacterium]|nr:MAG: hypothetical protein CSA07_05520 [Bacteroidia bacterium]
MLEMLQPERHGEQLIPMAPQDIPAGFPTPLDHGERLSIDLNAELIPHPESTFCGRVRGESMAGEDIHDGDILVIDKSLEWHDGSTVVAYINGEFTVKTIARVDGHYALMPANPEYRPIPIVEGDEVRIWGVVKWVIHRK